MPFGYKVWWALSAGLNTVDRKQKSRVWKRTPTPWPSDPQPGHYNWSAYGDILILTTLTFNGP